MRGRRRCTWWWAARRPLRIEELTTRVAAKEGHDHGSQLLGIVDLLNLCDRIGSPCPEAHRQGHRFGIRVALALHGPGSAFVRKQPVVDSVEEQVLVGVSPDTNCTCSGLAIDEHQHVDFAPVKGFAQSSAHLPNLVQLLGAVHCAHEYARFICRNLTPTQHAVDSSMEVGLHLGLGDVVVPEAATPVGVTIHGAQANVALVRNQGISEEILEIVIDALDDACGRRTCPIEGVGVFLETQALQRTRNSAVGTKTHELATVCKLSSLARRTQTQSETPRSLLFRHQPRFALRPVIGAVYSHGHVLGMPRRQSSHCHLEQCLAVLFISYLLLLHLRHPWKAFEPVTEATN
mmetsp:Transcript_12548/g.34703  ORF Transcript_12548/g.34703 Transcript_12548/m.34703 type:complete len:348 (-) Transcript_12548:630-1673(-)